MTYQVALGFEDGVTRFITCSGSETVADASYRARINIPLDCRDGACGTCKSLCESGTYDGGDYIEDALTDDEAEQGYCLPCQMVPESDLVLQIPTTSDVAKTAAATHAATITAIDHLSSGTVAFTAELADRDALAFLPGQYVNVRVPGTDELRSYSFSTSPKESEVSFLVRLTPGGAMSTYLSERAAVGDELELTGPLGSFFLRESGRPALMLAGGTGLAPILAMLRKLRACDTSRPVHLVYGVSRDDDLVCVDQLEALAAELDGFTFATIVSDPDSTHAHVGYVTSLFGADELHGGEVDVYLCGPPPMVESVREHLRSLGVTPVNFYYEKFTPAVAAPESDTSTATAVTEVSAVTEVETDRPVAVTRITGPGVDSGEEHLSMAASDSQFDARMALELGALELTIGRLDETQLAEFRMLAESANAYIEGDRFLDAEAFTAANNSFHEFVFRCTGNDALLSAYRGLEVTTHMNAVLRDAEWVSRHIVEEHLQIVAAFERADRDAARYLVRMHTDHSKETMHEGARVRGDATQTDAALAGAGVGAGAGA